MRRGCQERECWVTWGGSQHMDSERAWELLSGLSGRGSGGWDQQTGRLVLKCRDSPTWGRSLKKPKHMQSRHWRGSG